MSYNPADDVMHVWMEYCNGGDLRKVSAAIVFLLYETKIMILLVLKHFSQFQFELCQCVCVLINKCSQ